VHQNGFDSDTKQQLKPSILAVVEEPLYQSFPNLSSTLPEEEFLIRDVFQLR